MKSILLTLSLCLASISFTSPTQAETKTYTFDPKHTYVSYHIKHFGYSTQTGKWMATGKLILDDKKIQNSKVNITIDVAKIVTGVPELDKHLKGEEFFNVAKFPTATYVSTSVERVGKERAIIHGDLTLRGEKKTTDFKSNSEQKRNKSH